MNRAQAKLPSQREGLGWVRAAQQRGSNEPIAADPSIGSMNRAPYQAEDRVLIEPYRGPMLAPIRTRPARRSLVYLRALADNDYMLPTRNALTWMRGVIGYPLSRFIKVGVFLYLFLIAMTLVSVHSEPVHCHMVKTWICGPVYPLGSPYSAFDDNTFEPLLGVIVLLLLLGLVFKRRGARYTSFPPTHSFAVAQYWGSNDIAGTWVGQRERIDPAP
jgi:hypothetical protein